MYEWLPPFLRDERYVPGMREYLANSGAGVDEKETCAARVFTEAPNTLDAARLRSRSAWWSTASTRTSPGARRKYIRMYSDPDYQGQKIGVTRYGFARNFSTSPSCASCTPSTRPRSR